MSRFSLILKTFLLGVFIFCAQGAKADLEILTLNDCLREVFLNNPLIQKERNDIERAHGTKLVFYSAALPTIGWQVSAGIYGAKQSEELVDHYEIVDDRSVLVPGSINLRPVKAYVLSTGGIGQPFFNLAIPPSISRGNWEVRVAEQNFYVVATNVLHLARLTFYSALFHQRSKILLEQILEDLEINARNMQQQFDAQLVRESSLLQAKTQVLNMQPGIIRTQNSYDESVIQLLQLMGRDVHRSPVSPEFRSDSPNADILNQIWLRDRFPNSKEIVNFDVAQTTQLALLTRPDLKLLRASIKESKANAEISRASYFPHTTLIVNGVYLPTNSFEKDGHSIRPGDTTLENSLEEGMSAAWHLDNGAITGTLEVIKANRDVLLIQLQNQEGNIPGNLLKLHDQMRILQLKQKILESNRTAAQKVLATINQSIMSGASSQYEFINAKNSLLNNTIQLLQNEYSIANTQAEFDRQTGGYVNFIFNGQLPH